MTLTIYNCDDDNFIKFIINVIVDMIMKSMSNKKAIQFDDEIQNRYGINIANLFENAAKFFRYYKYKNNYTICIDKNVTVNNNNVYEMCKFVNRGNLEIAGSNVFSDILKFVEENIDYFYSKYEEVM